MFLSRQCFKWRFNQSLRYYFIITFFLVCVPSIGNSSRVPQVLPNNTYTVPLQRLKLISLYSCFYDYDRCFSD